MRATGGLSTAPRRPITQDMGGFRRASAFVLATAVALSIAAALARAGLPELGAWTREGITVSDVWVHNIDLLRFGGGKLRAYYMKGGQILSMTSTDDRTFVADAGVRMDAAGHPTVVRLADGRVRLYYVSTDPADGGVVRSAISDDGLAFAKEKGTRLRPGSAGQPDDSGIIHMDVLALPGGAFRMYYDAVGSIGEAPDWRGIRSAHSSDGLSFRKDPGFRIKAGDDPIAFADMVLSPFAERKRGTTKLFFSLETDRRPAERVGVYVATSQDGLSFSIKGDHPALGLDPAVGTDPGYGEGGMLGLPQDPAIIDVDGGRRLFYWQAEEGTFSAFIATP
jgi:hypothetical protein